MTRQDNEDPAVPQGRRKSVPTERAAPGGKGIPVNQQAKQLPLSLGTAEYPDKGANDAAESTPRLSASHEVPWPNAKGSDALPARMEEVVAHLHGAFVQVASNKGAPGPDGRSIEEVREHLREVLSTTASALLQGTYEPGEIRRVWIPKAGGGQRGLGIPNVVDRVVQEALRRSIEPLYEPTFHPSSHGFRPGRSCHTAIEEAKQHIEAGYGWVVDLDLEEFFDRVCHQRLMARLEHRIEDERVLSLVRKLLQAKIVMPDGVVQDVEQGVPQGGPLSPLLSNIVLDELDKELGRRGHRFVRYADDTNVYVKSQRAGERVMASLTRFIEGRLRLKVNVVKSAVAKPEERHFVGFTLHRDAESGEVEVQLSKRSRERIDARIRELTPRNWGNSLRACIRQLNEYLVGWFGFFGICTQTKGKTFGVLDAHIRRRLRAIILKHWKRKRTIARRLIQLGVKPRSAWRQVYGSRRSLWALSHNPAVERALRNAYFAERGLVSLRVKWRQKHTEQIVASAQLRLALG